MVIITLLTQWYGNNYSVAYYCPQAANQHRSATMPSCKGGLACFIEPCSLHLQNFAAMPSTSTG